MSSRLGRYQHPLITAMFLDILYVIPFLLPILIGYFAERIFRTRLFGRLLDIVIGLVGGIGLYVVVATINSIYSNNVAAKFCADRVERWAESAACPRRLAAQS
jgi:uncharacterized membrane protein YeaQ/YmgE (transglycosylase-associated protein family)